MTGQAYVFLLIGLVVFGAAYKTQTSWLYLMAAGTAGLLIGAAILAARQLVGVRLEVAPCEPVPAGEPVIGRVRLSRTRGASDGLQLLVPHTPPRAWFTLWRARLVPPAWATATVAGLASDHPVEATVSLPAARRGEWPWPALVLQSAYPLGVIAWIRRIRPAARYLVYPRLVRLGTLDWLSGAGAQRDAPTRPVVGPGTESRGVREYRPGDPWRDLHWRTTARRGEPHVREREREGGDPLVLFLDLRAGVYSEDGLEHAVAIALAIFAYAESLGRPVRLLTQPEAEPTGPAVPGPQQLVWLARAQAIAPGGPFAGPSGAVVISGAYLPGWQSWASAFVYCPDKAANALDATVYAPLGVDLAVALAERRA